MTFTGFWVRNPVSANLLMAAVFVGGIYAALNLRREMFPAVETEAITVSVEYAGATPEEVERLVARRVERAVEGIEEIEEVISQVFEGLLVTRINLEERADRDRVLSDVRSAIDDLRADLPDSAEEPEITSERPILPVISVVVAGEVSESRLLDAARRVRDDLLDLVESAQVTLAGVRDREIWVEVKPDALEEHGLTFEQVGRVLQESNLDLPAGQLKARSGNIRVRTLGETGRAAELADMQVKSLPDGTALRFGELAAVRETFADSVERGRFMGKRAALVTVFKTPEEDAVLIAREVKEYVKRPAPFGDAIELTATRDLSRFIRQRLDLMVRNAHLGLLLVILVLAAFLELRVALWVAVGLAVSFLGTFLAMMLLGETINLISMFGLIVVLGLLVDDAIVIGESVFTRRRQGLPPEQAAIRGTNEVAAPVVTAIFTTMVAFLPMAFLDGRVGAFLRVLPIVVVCALSVSLFEAFVVLPTHLAHKFKPPRQGLLARVGALRQELLEHRLRALFSRVVRRALQWRYATLAGVVGFVLIAAGIVAGEHVPFVLMGSTDAETLLVDLEMTPGTSEDETDATLKQIEAVLDEVEEIDSYFTVVGMTFQEGRRGNVADPATVGQITVEMKPADERARKGQRRTQTVVNDLRRRSLHLPGVRSLTYQAQGGGPQGADIEVRLRGKDLSSVSRATGHVRRLMGSYEGVTEVTDDLVEGKLELRYSLRNEARSLGLTTRDLALQIRHALFGFEVQDLQEEDEEVTVRVLLPESERRRIEDLSRLRIATPSGGRVPLEEVAALKTARGYSTLTRVDGQRAFTVSAQVDEEQANVARLTAGLQSGLSDLEGRFPGVTWSFEGSKEEMRKSLSSLRFGFTVAAVLIYGLVAMLFRSYILPVLVMVAIPVSFVGVVFGHAIMGYPLTLLSMIGAVALAGIVVNDSLILVDLINRKRRSGTATFPAVMEGSKERLRAILLTSATTIAGLAPLMLEQSFQAQFLIPMAISIVFGLAFATVLTLLVVPTCYLVLEDIRLILRWTWTGRTS